MLHDLEPATALGYPASGGNATIFRQRASKERPG